MDFFPAIDLKDGQCVRLLRGEMDAATVFGDDPAAQAKAFVEQGAEWIHVVDLNGAFEGKPVNADAVADILDAVDVPIQLGGGIRSVEQVTAWLDAGVTRVILGTVALKQPEVVREACAKHPGKIVVGIDARGGMVATEGWADVSDVPVIELAKKFEDAGVSAIIYTDVGRDGAMEGPDLEGTAALAQAISIPVIASGGVSSLDDLRALKMLEQNGIGGVISGRAIYDGAFSIEEAIGILD